MMGGGIKPLNELMLGQKLVTVAINTTFGVHVSSKYYLPLSCFFRISRFWSIGFR